MRRFLTLALVALMLGGCGHFGDVVKLATGSIENPISGVEIYRVKNAYTAALEIAAEWHQYCFGSPYRKLMASPVGKRLCANRRPIARQIESADDKAKAAIVAAESFVANNPTLSAVGLIGAAWDAVTAFKNAAPAK